jgi:hypothetical protein
MLVNANKWSVTGDSLYGLRRQVIRDAAERGVEIDTFGAGWDNSWRRNGALLGRALVSSLHARTMPHLREGLRGLPIARRHCHGPIADKLETGSAYQMAVVIENSATYVSEKVFDALRAGCVPVYVGPPLGEYGIPEAAVLQVAPRADRVISVLADTSPAELLAVQAAGQRYLASTQTEAEWGMSRFAVALADLVTASASAVRS